MFRYLCLTFLAFCFHQNLQAQTWLKWQEKFHQDSVNWQSAKFGNTKIETRQDALVFTSKPSEPLHVKMKEMYMDFGDDFIIDFTLTTAAPIIFYWNGTLNGDLGHQLKIEANEFQIDEISAEKKKLISKGKFRITIKNGKPIAIKISQRNQQTSIELNQNGNTQQLTTYKATNFPKQFSIGFKSETPQQSTIQLSSFQIHYLPYKLTQIVEVPFFGNRERLPDSINSPINDIWPYMNPSGSTFYFAQKDFAGNITNRSVANRIEPSNDPLQVTLNSLLGFERLISAAEDGNKAHIKIKNEQNENSILILERDTADKFNTQSLKTPIDILLGSDANIFISNSGNILIHSAELKGGLGGKDLYVTLIDQNGNIGKSINLGAGINAEGDEIAPFLAPDERTLYFSSTSWPGYGEMDIYISKRLDDTWTNWSPIKNMGRSVNTFDWDGYFTIDGQGEYGYFSSYGEMENHLDIFKVKLPRGAGPEPFILVSGYVRNSKTEATMMAEVSYKDINNPSHRRTVSTNRNGFFRFILPENRDYAMFAHEEGFYPRIDTISLKKNDGYREVNIDLYLTPIENNGIIGLNNIFFQQSRPEILPTSYPELDNLITTLNENPTMKIRIDGHTDGMGNRQMNINLSKARANAIREYLIEQGIEGNRIRAVGFGPDRPIADNADPIARVLNRRVEFTVIER